MVVEVELLGGLRKVGLGSDEAFEIAYGKAGWKIKSEKLLVEFMVGGDDRYGNSRPAQVTKRSVLQWSSVAQVWFDGETALADGPYWESGRRWYSHVAGLGEG